MRKVYEAMIMGGHLEWVGDAPSGLPEATPTRVTVLVEESESAEARSERGRRMAEALQQIANRGGSNLPDDPVAWQREVRRERDLPGRGE